MVNKIYSNYQISNDFCFAKSRKHRNSESRKLGNTETRKFGNSETTQVPSRPSYIRLLYYRRTFDLVSIRFNFILSYATPSSPQEKIWVGNSKICKESNNPIYQPADEQQPAVLYESTDNTCVPLVGNKSGAAENDNPLYDVGDVASTHVYAEPISSPQKNVVYDKPDVKI